MKRVKLLVSGKNILPHKSDPERIMRDFRTLQSRQYLAIAVTLLLLLILTLLYKRTDLFGVLPKDFIFAAQAVIIAAFVGFSAMNWRCPSCRKYLGKDINRRVCKQCGTKLR